MLTVWILPPHREARHPGPDGLAGSLGLKGPQVCSRLNQPTRTRRKNLNPYRIQHSLQKYRCFRSFQSNEVRKQYSLDLYKRLYMLLIYELVFIKSFLIRRWKVILGSSLCTDGPGWLVNPKRRAKKKMLGLKTMNFGQFSYGCL